MKELDVEIVLRKMGKSTGMIVPEALLAEIGVAAGSKVDLRIEDGQLVAGPFRKPREGWAEAAERLAKEPLDEEEKAWLAFGNDADDELTW